MCLALMTNASKVWPRGVGAEAEPDTYEVLLKGEFFTRWGLGDSLYSLILISLHFGIYGGFEDGGTFVSMLCFLEIFSWSIDECWRMRGGGLNEISMR